MFAEPRVDADAAEQQRLEQRLRELEEAKADYEQATRSIGDEQKCVYEDGWKLVLHESGDGVALYSVDGIADETVNTARSHRDKARELLSLLEEQLDENVELRPDYLRPPAELTPEQRERLESLGYL